MKISCVIPVGPDNYQWLHQAAQSARYWCDEVIISAHSSVMIDYRLANEVIKCTKASIAMQENLGIWASTGDWVMCLDSDDWLLNGMSAMRGHLTQHSIMDVVYGKVLEFVDTRISIPQYDHTWPAGPVNLDQSSIPCGAFFTKHAWKLAGGVDNVFYEDWHFWKKLRRIGCGFHYYQEDFYAHRRWPGSVSGKMNYDSSRGHTPLE